MAALVKTLGIDQLDIEFQLALIDELWVSISESADLLPISSELENLLTKRVAEYEANPKDVYSLDEVMDTVRKDLGK